VAKRNLRNRKVSPPENCGSECQSHSLGELDEGDCELETPNNKCAIAVQKISPKQGGNISGNMKAFFNVIRRFKLDVATATETLNSNFKTEK